MSIARLVDPVGLRDWLVQMDFRGHSWFEGLQSFLGGQYVIHNEMILGSRTVKEGHVVGQAPWVQAALHKGQHRHANPHHQLPDTACICAKRNMSSRSCLQSRGTTSFLTTF
jgi:hypothetical protein